jgi:hypothetical protein
MSLAVMCTVPVFVRARLTWQALDRSLFPLGTLLGVSELPVLASVYAVRAATATGSEAPQCSWEDAMSVDGAADDHSSIVAVYA